MNRGVDPGIDELKLAPQRLVEITTTQKFSFDRRTLDEIQLAALQKRFAELVDRIPVLQRFAEEQRLREMRTIEDGALLLFPHTLYKSYPLSAIEKGRFDVLTRWVGALTTVDLSSFESASCRHLDEWIDLLDARTELRLRHSSGTTGKLSFIPGSTAETYTAALGFKRFFEGFGDEPDAQVNGVGSLSILMFAHRKGAMSSARMADSVVTHLYGGDDSKLIATNPGRLSADMLSLGGRLQGAQARGERGRMQLSPGLLARREEFAREQAEQPRRLREFFQIVHERFRGQRVILHGVLPAVVEGCIEGVKQGYERLFAADSLFFVAGGAKGRDLPGDYRDQVERFSGVPFPRTGYGMTEAASAITRMCPHGHYHIPPNIVPYLLDPTTGAQMPRKGRQTGRYGCIDVATQTRWGGFLTGDEVTLSWGDESPCPCGRRGAYIDGNVRRYSEAEGGDDKITCAGAPGVHEKALAFMTEAID